MMVHVLSRRKTEYNSDFDRLATVNQMARHPDDSQHPCAQLRQLTVVMSPVFISQMVYQFSHV